MLDGELTCRAKHRHNVIIPPIDSIAAQRPTPAWAYRIAALGQASNTALTSSSVSEVGSRSPGYLTTCSDPT